MDWNKAIQFGQLVNAAYNAFEGKPYPTPGFDVLATIYGNDLATDRNPGRGDTRVLIGLILQAQGSGAAVVAIRGTEGIKEWVPDAQFGDTPFAKVAEAGRTEDGFTAMYKSMTVGNVPGAQTVVDALAGIPWKRPVTSLTICGHSLGGALATMFALDVAANKVAPFSPPTVYTYASPRTGNPDFATKYGQMISTTYRFVDNVDLVPKLPSPFFPGLPYRHVCEHLGMDSMTLIPPKVRLQPNPVCWHILSSYIYLMSLASGGPVIAPETECAPLGLVHDILDHIEEDLSDEKSIRDEFTAAPRTNMGGN